MPELPEVETLKRRLQRVLPGKSFANITSFHSRSFHGDASRLMNQEVVGVFRKAKILEFKLDSGDSLLTHLKMTGQLIYIDGSARVGGGHPTPDWVESLPSKHTRISYHFHDETALHFNDQRLFGWMKLVSADEVNIEFSKYAPDIDTDQVTPEYFWQMLQRRTAAIKLVLLNPQVVSGLGNIYVCDALNLAQISPFRPARSLSKAESTRLLEAAKEVIRLGIEHEGTTFDGSYVNIDGLAGRYQNVALVYGRKGKACKNCGEAIIKEKLGGRGTFFCPICQT